MIMLVEDDFSIRDGLFYYLEQEGFKVKSFEKGMDAVENFNDEVSLILLDINLPDIDGFEVFQKIKLIRDVPIIFLTAADLEISVLKGLDLGADDYITKPFRAKELVLRIKNVLKRYGKMSNIITYKNLKIDTSSAKVYKDEKEVFLTALEYKILLIFISNPNKVFTRESILSNIWDVSGDFVNDNTLTVYIKRIREKLDDVKDPKIIVTVRNIGYKLGE